MKRSHRGWGSPHPRQKKKWVSFQPAPSAQVGQFSVGVDMVGNLAPLAYIFAPDNILRNSFANFAFENYEVASYRSLIATAEIGNFGYAIPLLQQTLDEEVAMARFCHENLPALTQRYLRLRAAGKTASH